MAQKVMSLDEVADYLHIDKIELQKLARQGEMPYCSSVEGRFLFEKEAIDAWASKRILQMNIKRLSEAAKQYKHYERKKNATNIIFHISDLTSQNLIDADLCSKTKASVLSDLTKIAERHGLLFDPQDLLHSLRAREEMESTGLEGGVAIVHPHNHDPYLAENSFLAIAKTAHPIHFGAPDGKPTDIFFLLVCTDDRHHLRALARLCMMIIKTDLLNKLREADSEEAMLESFRKAEEAIVG